jgi:K+-transporting ATPase ATPase C chain
MKKLFSEFRSAVMVTLVLAAVCCGLYPLIVFGVAQTIFRDKANGSLIVDKNGTVRGSKLLGQQFTADKYFHPRPSAAGSGYDASSSGGSNLGPTSKKLADTITQNIADYRLQNGLATNAPVPADAVTASGSGLDPHISVNNAELQTPRVAKARGLSEAKVLELVRANTDPASLGFLGEPGVNVLLLNVALDQLASQKPDATASKSGAGGKFNAALVAPYSSSE